MTGDQFRRIGQKLYGSAYGWQARYARALGVNRSTVTRYIANGVQGPVEKLAWELWVKSLRERV